MSSPPRWKADAALATAALLWGATFVVVKGAIRDMSTMYFLAVRFTFGSVCMALLFQRALRTASPRQLWRGLRGGGIAGLFLWLGYGFQTNGLKYTTAGNSGFITGLYIVLVPLISAALYRRWPRLVEIAGIAIATAGMVVLTIPSVDRHFRINRGDLLTVGCAVAYAFHLLILGYFSKREYFEAVALGQIVVTAGLSAIALLFERPEAHWNVRLLLAIAGTGFFATALTFALQTWGQRYTTATRAAIIFALEPVFSLLTAVLVGGEPLTAYSVAGGCLILGSIFLVELNPRRRSDFF